MQTRRDIIKIVTIVIFLLVIFGVGLMITNRVFSYDTKIAHPKIVKLAVELYNKQGNQHINDTEIG